MNDGTLTQECKSVVVLQEGRSWEGRAARRFGLSSREVERGEV